MVPSSACGRFLTRVSLALVAELALNACGAPQQGPAGQAHAQEVPDRQAERPTAVVQPTLAEAPVEAPSPSVSATPTQSSPPLALFIAESWGGRVFVLGDESERSPASREGATRIQASPPVDVHSREGVVSAGPYHLFAADGTRCEGTNPRPVVLDQPRRPGPSVTNDAIEVDATCAAVLALRGNPAGVLDARFVPASESVTVSRPSRRACPVFEASNADGRRVQVRSRFEDRPPLGVLEIGEQRILLIDDLRRDAFDLSWATPREVLHVLVPGAAAGSTATRCRPATRSWPRQSLDGSLDVFSVERLWNRTFVILDQEPPGEPTPRGSPDEDRDEDRVVRAIEGGPPTSALTLLTAQGERCEGANPRWVRIDVHAESDEEDGSEEAYVAASFLALEVDASCDARLAVVVPPAESHTVTLTLATPAFRDDLGSGDALRTGDLGDGWTFAWRRGERLTEFCFGGSTTTITQGGSPMSSDSLGYVLGRLRIGARTLLVNVDWNVVDLAWASLPRVVDRAQTPSRYPISEGCCD